MSQWDSDFDHADWLHGPYYRPNALCGDCHRGFVKGPDDVGDLCDDCCARRDAARALMPRARTGDALVFAKK